MERSELNLEKEKTRLLDQLKTKDSFLLEDWLYPTCGVKMMEIKTEKGTARGMGTEVKTVYKNTIIGTIVGEESLILFVKENGEGTVLLESLLA